MAGSGILLGELAEVAGGRYAHWDARGGAGRSDVAPTYCYCFAAAGALAGSVSRTGRRAPLSGSEGCVVQPGGRTNNEIWVRKFRVLGTR